MGCLRLPHNNNKKKMIGTYVLVIRLREPQEISVGRLGVFPFHHGYYVYIGSAFGPGGLKARIRRHL